MGNSARLPGRRLRFALSALALLLPPIAGAQSINGVVVDRTDAPVAGVVVILLDNASLGVARALSNDRGEFRLTTSKAGRYRVRTMRIGFLPVTSEPITLADGKTVTQRFVLGGIAFSLDTIRVTGRTTCKTSREGSAATFAVWDQVRTALTATQLTAGERTIKATTIAFDRTVDPFFQRIKRENSSVQSALVTQPWRSQTSDNLRRFGYVVANNDTTTYFAPGLEVLLSDSFFTDHCFHLVSSPDVTRIGIAFEPLPDRRLSDIRGTVWLDRNSSELRRLEFGYANVSRQQVERAGGDMEFVRMRNGLWAIRRWTIRMPVLGERSQTALIGSEPVVVETLIAGGELSLAMRGGDTLWARPPLVLRGSVVDSLSGKPVNGAYVALMGTTRAAVTDTSGRFAIGGMLPGDYTAEVHTAILDEIDAVNQTRLVFTDSVAPHFIRVPSSQQIRNTLCGPLTLPMTGIVVGSVELRGAGSIPPGTRVFAEWNESGVNNAAAAVVSPDRWIESRTDASGRFRICGLPINTTLSVRAVVDDAAVASVPVVLIDGAIGRAELTADKQVQAGALFTGLVLIDSTHLPIADAEVFIIELALRARTNARGVFRFSEVPPGTWTLGVRRVGYGPLDAKLTFAANKALERQILLTRVALLDSVRVVGGRADMAEFEENRKLGLGSFVTRDALERQRDRRMSTILASLSGAQIVGGTNHAWIAGGRGSVREGIHYPDKLELSMGAKPACYSQVYLNGSSVYKRSTDPLFDINTLSPDAIEAIEFYSSLALTPARYVDPNMPCGVVVIWNRRAE
jgi:hypothetical protein